METATVETSVNVQERFARFVEVTQNIGELKHALELLEIQKRELTVELLPEARKHEHIVINSALLKYKTRDVTTTPYKAVFEEALRMMNKRAGEKLSVFKEAVTERKTVEYIDVSVA